MKLPTLYQTCSWIPGVSQVVQAKELLRKGDYVDGMYHATVGTGKLALISLISYTLLLSQSDPVLEKPKTPTASPSASPKDTDSESSSTDMVVYNLQEIFISVGKTLMDKAGQCLNTVQTTLSDTVNYWMGRNITQL